VTGILETCSNWQLRSLTLPQQYAPQLAVAHLSIDTLMFCRWRNATGTQIWPDYGSVFGAFPENSKQKLFYAFLLKHMFKQHGYIPGVNFFIIPFDWRTGIQGLEQVSSSTRCSFVWYDVTIAITLSIWAFKTTTQGTFGVLLCPCRMVGYSGSLTISPEPPRSTVARRLL
jgi:hypothetical protein